MWGSWSSTLPYLAWEWHESVKQAPGQEENPCCSWHVIKQNWSACLHPAAGNNEGVDGSVGDALVRGNRKERGGGCWHSTVLWHAWPGDRSGAGARTLAWAWRIWALDQTCLWAGAEEYFSLRAQGIGSRYRRQILWGWTPQAAICTQQSNQNCLTAWWILQVDETTSIVTATLSAGCFFTLQLEERDLTTRLG